MPIKTQTTRTAATVLSQTSHALGALSLLALSIFGTLPMASHAGEALATVNGKPVDEFIREAVVRQLKSNGQPVDEEQILAELINLELLAQKAEEQKLHEKDEIAALLQLQYNQTLAQSYMGELARTIDISEQDLRDEYDRQTADMTVDEYRASHILLENEADADSIIQALADGADFVELAKTRSTGPTGPKGGDLGWFQLESMVPEFSNALKTMDVGGTSEAPVKSDFGWHVIKLVNKRGTNKPDFNDIRADLNNLVMREKLTLIIDQMRNEADITITE